MYDRAAALAASQAEVQRLTRQELSELTPSRRDFAMFVATDKQDLGFVARLSPEVGWPFEHVVALAQAYDEAEVAALAVTTGPGGLPIEQMRAVAAASTAPLLRENLVLHPSQIHYARLYGADAIVLPASGLESGALRELVDTARSLHMASVIEVGDEAELAPALALPHIIVGLRCAAGEGRLDLERLRVLVRCAPSQSTLLVLTAVRTAEECSALRGLCDSACVTLAPGDPVAVGLQRIRSGL
jgi:indole-3-glycerol phosphate synthase